MSAAGVTLRRALASDVDACGRIIHDAFREVAERHGFPPAFHSVEAATRVIKLFVDLPVLVNWVAEVEGRVVGSISLDEGDEIRAVALVAVDPSVQGRGVGRRLMKAALERARGAAGVRLVQEAYNRLAMALYASLGFEVKEPLVRIVGRPRSAPARGVEVRPLTVADLDECARLCQRVHGIDRSVDLRDGIGMFSPFAAVRAGRITACTYAVWGGTLTWGIAETEADMRALLTGIGAVVEAPLAFQLPTRQASFFRWCLDEGFRIEKPLTLMAMGRYQEPRGCWFPSGFY